MATIKATNHVLQQQPSGKAQDKELITYYLTDVIALSLQCYHDINNTRSPPGDEERSPQGLCHIV